jgi:hypothetical protein
MENGTQGYWLLEMIEAKRGIEKILAYGETGRGFT